MLKKILAWLTDMTEKAAITYLGMYSRFKLHDLCISNLKNVHLSTFSTFNHVSCTLANEKCFYLSTNGNQIMADVGRKFHKFNFHVMYISIFVQTMGLFVISTWSNKLAMSYASCLGGVFGRSWISPFGIVTG